MAGLGLGLAATECAFRARDEGAFPHVNLYVEDPRLGVRLQPGASMRFKLGGNPRTTIHVNASGYRGADWPEPPQRREIVVVGDSQVFGLGVEDGETLASRLAERTGRPVIGAGVPTYGPREYLEVARELLGRRRPETVVVVLDFVDDPFELARANGERHAVWDGWAVRRETMPDEVTQFPGRGWLMSRSHAVYALRRWLYGRATNRGEAGGCSIRGRRRRAAGRTSCPRACGRRRRRGRRRRASVAGLRARKSRRRTSCGGSRMGSARSRRCRGPAIRSSSGAMKQVGRVTSSTVGRQ
ncbi:hypothetical protein OV079_25715 [Nannocystis pusilla]|uniref:SGNH hydrolase-type esterase domain-containing protein n=1 Tax=Nannocystis pusilla TaxID=889268 RepID=A0A9X3IZS0_9BACT|nr:hypothetical protein [Nannocystis pusilla]MCY1008894.1 hypothetical protein [Nannocystis pusilla]